jgi:hypothetical protein
MALKARKKSFEMHHEKSKILGYGASTTTVAPQVHRPWRHFL